MIFRKLYLRLFKSRKNRVIASSENAIGLFQKAIQALNESNENSEKLLETNTKAIEKLTADNDVLFELSEKNKRIISNIENLLK